MDNSSNNKRIAKNTLFLYVRMSLSMVVSFVVVRILLKALGEVDYGIYNAVGGFVVMCSALTTALSAATSRFLTFNMGKGNMIKLKEVFICSLFIHLALATIILLLTETIGVWYLNTVMTIPESRMVAANWILQCAIFSFVVGLIGVPFFALVIAHEKMKLFAYVSMAEVLVRLITVLLIAYTFTSADKLILYAVFCFIIVLSVQIYYITYSKKKFEECVVRIKWNKYQMKEMTGYAGWNFISGFTYVMRDQGVNQLLNIFCGPAVNAARGISYSIKAALSGCAYNFMAALNPQITKQYAAGDFNYTISLVERGSRFSFFITLLLSMPVLLGTDYILKKWLANDIPDYTAQFVKIIIIVTWISLLAWPLEILQNATGKIRKAELIAGCFTILNLPISYLILYLGYSPVVTMAVAVPLEICCRVSRLLVAKQTIKNFPTTLFLKKVYGRAALVFVCAISIPMIFRSYYVESNEFLFFVETTLLSLLCTTLSIYFIGCQSTERQMINAYCEKIIYKKIRPKN